MSSVHLIEVMGHLLREVPHYVTTKDLEDGLDSALWKWGVKEIGDTVKHNLGDQLADASFWGFTLLDAMIFRRGGKPKKALYSYLGGIFRFIKILTEFNSPSFELPIRECKNHDCLEWHLGFTELVGGDDELFLHELMRSPFIEFKDTCASYKVFQIKSGPFATEQEERSDPSLFDLEVAGALILLKYWEGSFRKIGIYGALIREPVYPRVLMLLHELGCKCSRTQFERAFKSLNREETLTDALMRDLIEMDLVRVVKAENEEFYEVTGYGVSMLMELSSSRDYRGKSYQSIDGP